MEGTKRVRIPGRCSKAELLHTHADKASQGNRRQRSRGKSSDTTFITPTERRAMSPGVNSGRLCTISSPQSHPKSLRISVANWTFVHVHSQTHMHKIKEKLTGDLARRIHSLIRCLGITFNITEERFQRGDHVVTGGHGNGTALG